MIKKIALLFLLLGFSGYALAETYNLSGNWTDPTPAGPGYTPVYDAEWRINSGAAVFINDLPSPSFSTTITANPGDLIEVRVRNENTQGPRVSNWSAWMQAVAPVAPTVPADPTGVVITIVPQ